jgi:hypothetical protein
VTFLYFFHQFGLIKGSAAVVFLKPLDTGSAALCFLRFYFEGLAAVVSDMLLSVEVRGGS